MVVVARLPRLEAAPSAAPPVAAAGAPPVEPAVEAQPTPSSRPGRSGRRAGPRFPTLSTLILALAAGACWAAVWWQERTHPAVTTAERTAFDEVTASVGADDESAGSVTR